MHTYEYLASRYLSTDSIYHTYVICQLCKQIFPGLFYLPALAAALADFQFFILQQIHIMVQSFRCRTQSVRQSAFASLQGERTVLLKDSLPHPLNV